MQNSIQLDDASSNNAAVVTETPISNLTAGQMMPLTLTDKAVRKYNRQYGNYIATKGDVTRQDGDTPEVL